MTSITNDTSLMIFHDFQMILSISNTTLITSQNFDVNFDIISRSLIAYARGINFIVLALIRRTEEPVTSRNLFQGGGCSCTRGLHMQLSREGLHACSFRRKNDVTAPKDKVTRQHHKCTLKSEKMLVDDQAVERFIILTACWFITHKLFLLIIQRVTKIEVVCACQCYNCVWREIARREFQGKNRMSKRNRVTLVNERVTGRRWQEVPSIPWQYIRVIQAIRESTFYCQVD